jgi:hypothetical protein
MAILWFLAGCATEVLNMFTRRWTVGHLGGQSPRQVVLLVMVGYVGRLAWTGVVLLLAFRRNLASGLAALLGYWVCRWAMVWWTSRSIVGH